MCMTMTNVRIAKAGYLISVEARHPLMQGVVTIKNRSYRRRYKDLPGAVLLVCLCRHLYNSAGEGLCNVFHCGAWRFVDRFLDIPAEYYLLEYITVSYKYHADGGGAREGLLVLVNGGRTPAYVTGGVRTWKTPHIFHYLHEIQNKFCRYLKLFMHILCTFLMQI